VHGRAAYFTERYPEITSRQHGSNVEPSVLHMDAHAPISRGSFGTFLLPLVLAEVLFATLVALALGTPPTPMTTVIFALAMAVALGAQHRWSAPSSPTRRDEPSRRRS
jgi:hypothetical protein